jgi:hypothetical protein
VFLVLCSNKVKEGVHKNYKTSENIQLRPLILLIDFILFHQLFIINYSNLAKIEVDIQDLYFHIQDQYFHIRHVVGSFEMFMKPLFKDPNRLSLARCLRLVSGTLFLLLLRLVSETCFLLL